MSNFLRNVFGKSPDLRSIHLRGATIIDVRSRMEFRNGHIQGAVNIPLDTLAAEIDALKEKGKPIIACCRSGARSGAAVSLLGQSGLEAYNGGAWSSLERIIRPE
ncbi:MAG TPA: rhodanese-like domain-containing protein [Puia sp.]|nr:rhodanese-like domain-containing protein [Puia sp.]